MHAAFEQNLSRLRQRDAELALALECAPTGEIEIASGPRGATTASYRGVLLASAYDPEGEGERIAAEIEACDLLVAVGLGLGHHLEAYRRRNECPLLVYEPNLPRLRAAFTARDPLALVDLTDVRFATNLDALSAWLHEYYTPGLRIGVFPHPASLRLDSTGVSEAVGCVGQVKRVIDVGGATRVRQTAPWAEVTVDNAPELLKTPSFSRLEGAFAGMPAVIAAAGPSLDKQLPLLARYAGRVLVIAIGQTLRSLRNAGIEPDLVHAIESQDISAQFTNAGDTSNLNLVLLPSVHPSIYGMKTRTRFVAYPVTNQIGCWIAGAMGESRWIDGAPTVAQSAVYLAAAAGANPIALVGQDLAFTEGRVYAADSAYDCVGLRRTDEGYVLTDLAEKRSLMGVARERQDSDERELVWVKGWNGERLPTSVSYASFLEQYRLIGANLADKGVRLVNCTEGGARIPGLEHETARELLERYAVASTDARDVIDREFNRYCAPTATVLETPLRGGRRSLDRLERFARAGLARIRRALRQIDGASDQRVVESLRGVARFEGRVRRELEAVPWIDTFLQAEIHRVMAALGRTRAGPLAPKQAFEETRALFEMTLEGVERARTLLARLESRLQADSDENDSGDVVSRSSDRAATGGSVAPCRMT